MVVAISSAYRQSRSSTTSTDRRESRRFIGNFVNAHRNPPSGWRSIEAPVSGGIRVSAAIMICPGAANSDCPVTASSPLRVTGAQPVGGSA